MNNISFIHEIDRCNFRNKCKSKIGKMEHLYDFEVGKNEISNENENSWSILK